MAMLGKGYIFSLDGAALATGLSGYVSPNLKSAKIRHVGEIERVKGQNAITKGLLSGDEFLELNWDFIPEGTTIANAKLSAGLPTLLSVVTITGCPVINIGSFSDALNSAVGSIWIYEGGGELTGESESKWTATFPLRKYLGITSGSAIT